MGQEINDYKALRHHIEVERVLGISRSILTPMLGAVLLEDLPKELLAPQLEKSNENEIKKHLKVLRKHSSFLMSTKLPLYTKVPDFALRPLAFRFISI